MSRFADLDAELSAPVVNCKLCRLIDGMDPEDAAYVRLMLGRPISEKGHQHIATVLERGGVIVSASTVASCRAGRHQPRD